MNAASISFGQGMLFAGLLFATGMAGVILRRNIIFILLSIEIMLNAAGFAFIVAGARWGQPEGQVLFMLVLATAGAEMSIGLALVIQLHHYLHSLNVDLANRLRD